MFRAIAISSLVAVSIYGALAQPSPSVPATTATKQDPDFLPPGPGKDLVVKYCVSCHSIRNVTAKRGTKEEWNQTVDKMIEHGAPLSDAEADTVVQYLSASFGPSAAKPAESQTPAADNSSH